jgi:Bacterial Ig domain/MBG domain (YGX type)/Putative Ig domain
MRVTSILRSGCTPSGRPMRPMNGTHCQTRTISPQLNGMAASKTLALRAPIIRGNCWSGVVRKFLTIALMTLASWAMAATTPSDPTTLWTPLPYAAGMVSDYITDQQTGSGEGDIVGTSNGLHAVYTAFNAGNNPTNGTIGFRVRLAQDSSPAGYNRVMHVGIDGNADGAVELFVSADNSGATPLIRIFRAGAGLNISPNTTSIDSGNPIQSYSEVTSNYNWQAVTTNSDPAVITNTWPTPTNIDGAAGAGETDFFVSFFVPFADVVGALQSVGVSGITTNSRFRYIVGSATQPNALNQDINGINGGVNSSVTYSNLGIFTLPISPAGFTNLAPTVVNDSATTLEDTQVTIPVLVNDSDPDNNPLTITTATPTNGTVNIVGTNLVFLPATNFNGTATIGYTVSDGQGGTSSALVTITVTAFNDPPVAMNDSATTLEDTQVTIPVLLNDSDVESIVLTITTATPTNGTVNIVGTNLVFQPATNFNGTATIGYTVSDGQGGTASALVTITVTAVNDPPALALAIPDQTGIYGSPFSYTFATNTFIDVEDGVALTFSATNLPPGVTFNPGTRTFSGTPTAAGTFTVTVTATDSGAPALGASDTFDIVVAPAPLNVTAVDATRGFDQANPVFTFTITGFVLGDPTNIVTGAPVLTTTAVSNSPVGNYPINVAVGTLVASNYTFALFAGTLSVTGAVPVITWTPVGPLTYGTPLGVQLRAEQRVGVECGHEPADGGLQPDGLQQLRVGECECAADGGAGVVECDGEQPDARVRHGQSAADVRLHGAGQRRHGEQRGERCPEPEHTGHVAQSGGGLRDHRCGRHSEREQLHVCVERRHADGDAGHAGPHVDAARSDHLRHAVGDEPEQRDVHGAGHV